MTNYRRVVVRLSLALFLMASAILAYGWQAGTSAFFTAHAASQTYASCSTCTGTFYGGTSATMDAVIAQVWPQTSANACGIENAIAMVNYDDLYSGSSRKFTTSANQGYVAGDNNRYLSNASQWGAAKPYNQWGGYTNIAPDYGTDPRSIAFMMWFYSLSNRYFHDHIYRWQFAHSTQPSFTTQAMEATTGFVQALQAFQEPVSVTINGGLHSVVVSGAWSSNDPSQNYPAGIQGVVYRDPEGNNDPNSPYYSRQEVDINTWIGGNYGVNQGNPWGGTPYSLWSFYYGDKYSRGGGGNTADPEPTVGPYIPGSGQVHWYHGFTWIQRDNIYSGNQWNPDWAINDVSVTVMTTP